MACHLPESSQLSLSLSSQIWYLKTKLVEKEIKIKNVNMACHLSSQLSLLSQIWYLKTKLVSKEKGIKIKKTYQRVDMACHLSSKLLFGRPRDAKGRRETMIGQCDCARDFRE